MFFVETQKGGEIMGEGSSRLKDRNHDDPAVMESDTKCVEQSYTMQDGDSFRKKPAHQQQQQQQQQ